MCPVFRSLYDVVLNFFFKLSEVSTVAGDPDDEVAVFFRFLLRPPQYVRGNDIELGVPATQVHEGSDVLLK